MAPLPPRQQIHANGAGLTDEIPANHVDAYGERPLTSADRGSGAPTPTNAASERVTTSDPSPGPLQEILRIEAEAFITALTGAADSAVTFQTFPDDKNAASSMAPMVRHGSLAEHYEELVQANRAGQGIFVTVNETDGRGRKAKNVTGLRALFVDDDSGQLSPCTLSLPPSILVRSKAGLHAYWRLRPGDALSLFTPAQEALSQRFSTDPRVKDLPRVMRLPGFLHQKDATTPFMVRVLAANDAVYTVEAVLAGNGAAVTVPAVIPPSGSAVVAAADSAPRHVPPVSSLGVGAPNGAMDRARAYLARVPPAIQGQGGDHATYVAAATLVKDFDLADEDALSLLIEWNASCAPPWSQEDLAAKIQHARVYGKHVPGAKLDEPRPTPAPPVGTSGDPLASLKPESSLSEVGQALTALSASAKNLSRGDRALARERAIKVLQGVESVSSPAKVVDAFVTPQPASEGISLDDVEPADHPQVTGDLLDELVAVFERYLVLPLGAAVVLAVWVLHTWSFDASEYTPRLAIKSPAKRCAKSLVLEILFVLCARAIQSANLTSAVLFRAVDALRPTILVDEADTFIHGNDELRGVLNAGFSRSGRVLRCHGDDLEPKAFKCYAPVAIAAIGTLPSTVMDRAIPIGMERKRKTQRVARFRRRARADLGALRPLFARWALDNEQALQDATPSLPDVLNDRQQDIAEPLIAIGDLAGGEWPRRVREAIITLCGRAGDDADDRRERLLRAVWGLFTSEDFIPIKDIVARLLADPESEWNEVSRGRPITAVTVGKWLGAFGLKTTQPRSSPGRARGYHREDLAPVVEKYVSEAPEPQPVSPVSTGPTGLETQENVQPAGTRVGLSSGTGENPGNTNDAGGDTGGTGKNPPPAEERGQPPATREGFPSYPETPTPTSGPRVFSDADLEEGVA